MIAQPACFLPYGDEHINISTIHISVKPDCFICILIFFVLQQLRLASALQNPLEHIRHVRRRLSLVFVPGKTCIMWVKVWRPFPVWPFFSLAIWIFSATIHRRFPGGRKVLSERIRTPVINFFVVRLSPMRQRIFRLYCHFNGKNSYAARTSGKCFLQ